MRAKHFKAWLSNALARLVLGAIGLLPYRWRGALIGKFAAHVLAPLTGHERRALDNLALVCPELPPGEARRVARGAADEAARTLIEMYGGAAFRDRAARARVGGAGVAAVEQARAAGRPIIAVSGHFGNYHVARVVFDRAGHRVGSLYRPMFNPWFNRHYARHLEEISAPSFPQDRRGMARMIRHLRAGNMVAMLSDQRDSNGALLRFFGKPALTPLSAAEMALKYDALFVPVFVTRRSNGLDFDMEVAAPIPHAEPEVMMQAFNDILEERVRANMGHWLWLHRRWRVPRNWRPRAQRVR